MKFILSFLWLLLAVPAVAGDLPFYVGKWQSNEAKTLASMAEDTSVPEETRKIMREDFYGKLVNEFREDSFTTYFAGQEAEKPDFISADITIVGPDTITIRYFHARRGHEVEREITIVDDCYAVPVINWNFNEYFCRVK